MRVRSSNIDQSSARACCPYHSSNLHRQRSISTGAGCRPRRTGDFARQPTKKCICETQACVRNIAASCGGARSWVCAGTAGSAQLVAFPAPALQNGVPPSEACYTYGDRRRDMRSSFQRASFHCVRLTVPHARPKSPLHGDNAGRLMPGSD